MTCVIFLATFVGIFHASVIVGMKLMLDSMQNNNDQIEISNSNLIKEKMRRM